MKSKTLIFMLCAFVVLSTCSACGKSESEKSSKVSETASGIPETSEKEKSSSETSESHQNFSRASETKASSEKSDNPLTALGDIMAKDVEDSISALGTEYEQLKADIDTYDKYLSNIDKIKAFYAKIDEVNNGLCIKMCEYSLEYAELIINSDKSKDDKYDDLKELHDNVYEDAADEIHDGIYEDIFDNIKDDYYDGILKDAKANAAYDEWYNIRSDEYDLWYETRSDVYEQWYDCRSDIYSFWSDVRGEVWSDDIEKAKEKITDFQEDVESLKKKIGTVHDNMVSEKNQADS